MKELMIREQDSGQRLDKYLAKYLKLAPKGFLYKMMRKKNITLNGSRCEGSEKVAPGDRIRLFFSDETLEKFSGGTQVEQVKDRLDVVYEDRDLLFVNKRAGELSQKAKESDVSLVEQIVVHALRKGMLTEEDLKTCRPSVCNRLDRNTTGLVAAGLTVPGLRFLSDQLQSREMKKYYLCLVKGEVRASSHLKGFLAKDEASNQVTVAERIEDLPERFREDARFIETSYEPVCLGKGASLLKVHLMTGRSHQIRAHLASIGHPVIGDPKYGDPALNRIYQKECGLSGQLLHAWEMCFSQIEGAFAYLSGKSFRAPLPDQMKKACCFAGIDTKDI